MWTIINGEITGGAFEVGKNFSNLMSSGFGFLIVFHSDIDLLNLGIKALDLLNINDNGLVEIYAIEINGVLGFLKSANNNKFVTREGEGLANGLTGTKELKGKRMSNNSWL